jgi:hypothetical protein
MGHLGLRCSNNDYTFVVLKGDASCPLIADKGYVSFPKGFSRPHELKWFYQEIEGFVAKHKLKSICIKGAEGSAFRDRSFVARIENEAMVYLAGFNNGIKKISKKVKSTIAKDLGLKGKAKYLATSLNCSVFPTFDDETPKMQEAILAAWSDIK